ncbi:MAG: glycosyltransferase [Anditalea sp.]
MNLPKVLILIQPFNQNTGGGITLSNLFKGWPKDKLAVLCRGYGINSNTQTDICETYYQLGHREHKWKFPFNRLKRRYFSGILSFEKGGVKNSIPAKSKFRVAFLKEYVHPFLKWIGFLNFVSKIELSKQLEGWLDQYQPDIIYAQAQGRETVLFCTAVQEYLNKPMVFHMMDDWTELVAEGLFGKYWYLKIDGEFRKMLSKASLHLSISEPMAVEYKRRFGFDFQTFHNPIDLNFWKKSQRNHYELGKEPIILYAGRVGLGIQESLEVMAKAVTVLNKELNASIKFVLQVNERSEWMEKYACVQYRGFVSYEDLPSKFAEADMLYMPYDFSVNSIKFIKYSMPTKASEYMISGTPILIFAPSQTAIVDYARKYHWAKVVTDDNLEVLITSLKSMIMNKEERERIAQTAIQLAEDKHDAAKVRYDFKEALVSVMEEDFTPKPEEVG